LRNFVVAHHPFRKRVSGAYKARVFATRTISSFFATNMPNRLLYVQNSCLGWFRTISLSHVTHSENGWRVHTKHEFLPPKPFLRFSQRTCPIHYFKSKTHVRGGFAQFCWRTSPILKTVVGVHTKHEFLPPEPFLRFSQRTCPIHYFRSKTHVWGGFAHFVVAHHPFRKWVSGAYKARVFATRTISSFFATNMPIHYFWSKTHVWGGFAQFCCRTSPILITVVQFRCRMSPILKTVVGCIQSTSSCHRNHFLVFCNEHAQYTTLGPKLMFGVISRNFVAARHPFRKRVSGA
jgi:hypothetical protein